MQTGLNFNHKHLRIIAPWGSIDPQHVGTELIQFNIENIIGVDALAPCIAQVINSPDIDYIE